MYIDTVEDKVEERGRAFWIFAVDAADQIWSDDANGRGVPKESIPVARRRWWGFGILALAVACFAGAGRHVDLEKEYGLL